MHEMGIAAAVIEAVRNQTARYPAAHATKVAVRVGELAALDPEALRFCFAALVRGTGLENLQLEIQFCPRRHRCPGCSHEFVVHDYQTSCPRCGEALTHCIGGDELELAFLEVEQDEPSALATQY
jgi:hydrogenase nickel incorporation protein HypA/HybF